MFVTEHEIWQNSPSTWLVRWMNHDSLRPVRLGDLVLVDKLMGKKKDDDSAAKECLLDDEDLGKPVDK